MNSGDSREGTVMINTNIFFFNQSYFIFQYNALFSLPLVQRPFIKLALAAPPDFNRSFDKSEVLLRRIEYEYVPSSVRQAGSWARRLDSTPDHQLAQAGNRHQLAQAGNRTQNLLIESVAQRSTDYFALAPLLLRKRGTY